MADRRSSFFRSLFSSASSRRRRATRPQPAPPATTTPVPTTTTSDVGQPTTVQTPPTGAASSGPPAFTSPPPPEPQTAAFTSPPPPEPQMVYQSRLASPAPSTPAAPPPAPTISGSGPAPTPTIESQDVSHPTEHKVADQLHPTSPAPSPPPSSKVQVASPTEEPRTLTPSRVTARSPPSSLPASPSRRTAKSRSPPQSSSPSRPSPKARSKTASPSRIAPQTPSTPRRASQPRSPSRLASPSAKQTPSNSSKGEKPTSPSKESRSPTQEISSPHKAPTSDANGEGPKPEVPQSEEESQPEAEIKSDSANDSNHQTVVGTNYKHDEVEVKPSNSSELGIATTLAQDHEMEPATINREHKPLKELDEKPEEIKEVKEVVQEPNTEANEETKKEDNEFLHPKPGSAAQTYEKAEVPRPDQTEKQEALQTKEGALASLPGANLANMTHQPEKKSRITDPHNKSAPPGEPVRLHKDIRYDISSFINRVAIADPKSAIYDRAVSVITLAGENRGASMQMGSNSSDTEGPVHIHRGYKINPDESAEATSDVDGSSEGKQLEDANDAKDKPEAYVNNNTQGVNNSIVLNCSLTERNPGIHMVVAHVPQEPILSTGKSSPVKAQNAEFNRTRTDKLTNEPIVRRRCLRGLFLEPSDSDTENPEKPRRHGCRVGCQQMDKEKDIDAL